MKFKINFKEISELFLPAASVGGLQVTNSSIRFLRLRYGAKGGQLEIEKSASLRLPPGIIEDGKVKDRANFVAALKRIHSQIEKNPKKNVNVVLTIPTGDVYAEAFSLPPLHGGNLGEAVELNLAMVSPIPIEEAYHSAQITAGDPKAGIPFEVLGAFAPKAIIDEIQSCLEESGFGVAAVEFSSLSMARMLSFYKVIKKDRPYLLIKLTEEGLIFMILRNGSLYFDYFHSWGKFGSQSGSAGVTVEAIEQIIKSESARVLNFYSGRWGGQITGIILITPALIDEISQFLRTNFTGFEITVLPSNKGNLHGVEGAALRGLPARSDDREINLMNPNAINAFWQDEILSFISLWRNILLTVGAFLLIIFIAGDMFLRSRAESIPELPATALTGSEESELSRLRSEAAEFNGTVQTLAQMALSVDRAYPLWAEINSQISSNGIVPLRFSFNITGETAAIDGMGRDSNSVFAFKNALEESPRISSVDLPFQSLITQNNGQVSFTVNFKIEPE